MNRHLWTITKPDNPYWRKCSKCGIIRITYKGTINIPANPKRPEYTYKRGNRVVLPKHDPLGRQAPYCSPTGDDEW